MEQSTGRSLFGISATAIVDELSAFYYPLRWMMLLALVLILADLWWGIAAARVRKEKIKFSRAARRSGNKIGDYFYWITIAGLIEIILTNKMAAGFGISIEGIPIAQFLLLIFIYSIEIDSCLTNYSEARGIKFKWNIIKWVASKTSLETKEIETIYKNEKDET